MSKPTSLHLRRELPLWEDSSDGLFLLSLPPAKHIQGFALIKRLGVKPKEGPIPEEGEEGSEQSLAKSFGYGYNFGAKYELGRGHFGHTCSGRGKKGDIEDHPFAVKIISKATV